MSLEVDDLRRLKLGPGETLVARLARAVSTEDIERIRAAFAEALPGAPILVVSPEIDLFVLPGVADTPEAFERELQAARFSGAPA